MLLLLLEFGIDQNTAKLIVDDFLYIFGVAMGFSSMNLVWRLASMI